MDRYSRIRTIKLRRSGPGENFGFSARGGFEYGTGIFVSSVDPRSVAYKAKLRVGDQILRVNGYPVTYALHSEFVALMRSRNVLQLKIRSVGMIPVRESANDPLSWKLVEGNTVVEPSNYDFPEDIDMLGMRRASESPMAHSKRSSELDSWSNINYRDSRLAEIFVDTHGHSGLGCCICKGPPERPGIFVQSTKCNGIAKEAGLRPGDQILHCNGVSFIDIPFAEAAYHMKVSKKLNLIVIKGAAMDLFPGESSGYNSSASSSIGDHQGLSSRPSSDPNNHTSLEDPEDSVSFRLQRLPVSVDSRMNGTRRIAVSESDEESTALDRHTEWIEVEETWKEAEKDRVLIQTRGEIHTRHPSLATTTVSESGETVEDKRLQEERKKLIEEQRRLIEQAVKFEEEKRKFEEEKRQLERLRLSEENSATVTPKNSRSSSENESPKTLQSSLAGALHNEILKRVERRGAAAPPEDAEDEIPKPGTVDERITMFASSGNLEKKQQHEQLIKEFKKVHQKMFSTNGEDPNGQPEAKPSAISKKVYKEPEKKNFGILRTRKEVEHERKMVQHQVAGIVKQLQLKIERKQQDSHETEREVVQFKGAYRKEKSPPPPPPFPTMTEASLGKIATSVPINKLTSPEVPASKEKSVIITVCGEEDRELEVPKSPSPDYSNSSSPIPFNEKGWIEEKPELDRPYGKKFTYQEQVLPASNGARKKAPLPPPHRECSKGYYSNKAPGSSGQTRTGVIDYDAGQISTSSNNKVTIILREANHQGPAEIGAGRSSAGDKKGLLAKVSPSKLSKGSFPEIVM